MIQGVSNGGKTYWMSPLVTQNHLKGQTIPSQDFKFMNCIGKEIIEIPESTLSKIDEVEEFKKIITKTVPWKYYSEVKQTLQNRMFAYTVNKRSEVLEAVQKAADPRFYGE